MRITTITHALRPQWECYLTKQTHGVRAKVTVGNYGNGESREVQAWCTRHLAAGVIHSFLTPPARRRTTHAADYTRAPAVWRQFIYDWRLLKLSATVLDDWSCLVQPRRVVHTHTHHGGIKQLQLFERRLECRCDAWQINCWYRISHGGRTAAYRIVVGGQTAPHRRLLPAQYWARLLKKVLGQYQYHPILASIGQYPIPQYRYRSNPTTGLYDSIMCGRRPVLCGRIQVVETGYTVWRPHNLSRPMALSVS